MAVRSGNEELAEKLIARGAGLERRDAKGWTPLCSAAADGRIGMLRLLLRHGASLLAADDSGRVPRAIAERRGHSAAAQLLQRAAQSGLLRSEEEGEEDRWAADSSDPRASYLKSWRRFQGYT